MWQEIIITDVTRMSGDKVCVAGINHKGACVRPLLAYPNAIREADLYEGDTVIIRPRAVVNMFLEPEPEPEPPHCEDHLWSNPNQIEFLREPNDRIWKGVLERTSFPTVSDIFQADIRKNKMVAPGDGVRSLGTIKPASIDKFGYYRVQMGENLNVKYQLSFTDQGGNAFVSLPVTDLSLRYYVDYLYAQGRLHPAKIRSFLESKFQKTDVWLRLGLTRPFQKSDADQKWCYIQVTGIYTFPDYLKGRCFDDFKQRTQSI
jgi:hypothetical protein